MLTDEEFQGLMARLRAGERGAADELIRQFEPEIRLEARVRLRVQDFRLRRLLDTLDITQSVFGSFFAGFAEGRFLPETPQHLLGLLLTMTRNKLLKQVRDQRRQRRDIRRVQSLDPTVHQPQAAGETPSLVLAGRELEDAFRQRLTDEERQLAARRNQGKAWADIAAELGGTPEGRRKQLERAFVRVVRELGLEDDLLWTTRAP